MATDKRHPPVHAGIVDAADASERSPSGHLGAAGTAEDWEAFTMRLVAVGAGRHQARRGANRLPENGSLAWLHVSGARTAAALPICAHLERRRRAGRLAERMGGA